MTNKLRFAVEDIHLLEDNSIDTNQFSLLKVDAFATGKSLHNTFVTEETLRRTAHTILQKPFVFGINERFNDLSTHVDNEVAGGFVPHNSKIEFKTLSDGRLMLSVDVLIWKRYCGRLLDYFARDDGRKGVSVEIEVYESKDDPVSGLKEIVDFCYAAITGLGDMIQSAIPNAQAVMAFAKEFEEDKKNYEETSFAKYDGVDFTIPIKIKNNAKKSLELIKEIGGEASGLAMAIARFLSANEKISSEKIRQISQYLSRKNLNIDNLTLGLWGGKPSKEWSLSIVTQMDELDDKKLSYFGEDNFSEEDVIDKGMLEEKTEEQPLVIDNYLGIETEDEKIDMADEEKEKEKDEKEIDMAEATEEVEEKDEKDAKSEEKEETKKFSYAEIFATEEDFASMFAEDEDDDEDTKAKFASAKEEYGVGANPATVMSAMFSVVKKMQAKMAKLNEDNKVYMAENEDMKAKFAEIENGQKNFAVDTFLKELSEKVVIPEDKYSEMKEGAKQYNFAQIGTWQNDCKALVYDFEKVENKNSKNEEPKDEIIVYALHNSQSIVVSSDDDDPWKKLSK